MRRYVVYTIKEVIELLEKDVKEKHGETPISDKQNYEIRSVPIKVPIAEAIKLETEIAIEVEV